MPRNPRISTQTHEEGKGDDCDIKVQFRREETYTHTQTHTKCLEKHCNKITHPHNKEIKIIKSFQICPRHYTNTNKILPLAFQTHKGIKTTNIKFPLFGIHNNMCHNIINITTITKTC
jgi:hypothetical protein